VRWNGFLVLAPALLIIGHRLRPAYPSVTRFFRVLEGPFRLYRSRSKSSLAVAFLPLSPPGKLVNSVSLCASLSSPTGETSTSMPLFPRPCPFFLSRSLKLYAFGSDILSFFFNGPSHEPSFFLLTRSPYIRSDYSSSALSDHVPGE